MIMILVSNAKINKKSIFCTFATTLENSPYYEVYPDHQH